MSDSKKFLTDKEIQSFKQLIKIKTGVDFSDEEATSQGIRLVRLFELLINHKSVILNNICKNH